MKAKVSIFDDNENPKGAYEPLLKQKPAPKVKEGHWKKVPDYEWIVWECSECGQYVTTDFNYCPECGIKMKGDN